MARPFAGKATTALIAARSGRMLTALRFRRRTVLPVVDCPNCEAKLDAPAEYRGRTVKCCQCGKSFVLRFTGHSIPLIAAKKTGRKSEPPLELKSTVSFRLPDNPTPPPEEQPAPDEKSRRKKPHRDK
jgi:hypothetical protein